MAKKRVVRPDGFQPSGPHPGSAGGGTNGRAPSGRRTGPAPSRRARFEAWSRPLLLRMQVLPGFLVPVLLGVALFLGLALPWRWAGVLLIAIAAFLGWLTALSWPAVSAGSRALRVVVNLGVLALGIAKLLGWL